VLLGPKADSAEYFVPFIVEARMGLAARKFIGDVLKESKIKNAKADIYYLNRGHHSTLQCYDGLNVVKEN
jgi:hypothetical protein